MGVHATRDRAVGCVFVREEGEIFVRRIVPKQLNVILRSKQRKRWLKQGGMVVMLLLSAVLSIIGFSGMANAASAGCEQHQVTQGTHRYYQCTVEVGAGACLRERNVTTFAIEACVRGGTTVDVARQVSLKNHSINGSTIWDILNNGRMVSDDYINTGRYNAFSPPIPNTRAPLTTPTVAATATVTSIPTTTPTGNDTRFFNTASPWNVPIGSNVQLDPHSSAMVSEVANGNNHVPAMFDFGMPIYYSTASDPTYTVSDPGNDPLFAKEQPIHIPNDAAPSPGSDHWMFIYDTTKNLLFEMWDTSKSGNAWTTQTGDVYSTTGDGVLQIDGSTQSGNGASYFGGVITAADMARGSIHHALSLASQYTSSSWRYPMSASDGHNGTIPMGARFQLDPSINCATLPGASKGEQMVCQALETYGGYMRDTGGVALSMYFEGENLNDPQRNPPSGSPGNSGISSGVFGKVGLSDGQDLSAIPWNKMRVLQSWNSFTAAISTPTPTATITKTPTVSPAATTGTTGQVGQSGMLFDAELTGSSLDASKWTTCSFNFKLGNDCYHNQDELERYQPGGISVNNGLPAINASTAIPSTSHVSLASCSGSHCNGADPYSSGCAGNGTSYWVVDSVPVTWQGVNYGWAQLWYSATCGTNWARYVCSSSCRIVTLALMVCESNGDQYSVQGPIALSVTGRTKQQYLPTTRAATNVMFQIAGREYSGAATGCY